MIKIKSLCRYTQRFTILFITEMTKFNKLCLSKRRRIEDFHWFQLVKNLTSDDYAKATFDKISDLYTIEDPAYYGADFFQPEDHGTTHMGVIAPNGDAVAITSTINQLLV